MSGSSSALLQAACLWERISARGTRYMSGRWDSVKVVILQNRDYVEGDLVNGHTHTLFFQDGSSTQPRPAGVPAEQRERSRKMDRGGIRQPMKDDPMPF